MKPNFCRLSVLFAREASKAVVFRKGPSTWIQIVVWHTDTDKFETGQWFHGKIIQNWSDLSPDGSKLIYFASKHHLLKTTDPEYTDAWTAISKPPYLTALALWPGLAGGYFENNNTVRIAGWNATPPHRKHSPPDSLTVLPTPDGWQNPEIPPLARYGWIEVQRADRTDAIRSFCETKYRVPGVYQMDRGDYRIIMTEFGRKKKIYGGPVHFEFKLQQISRGFELPIDTETWAGWDQRGRLVYINAGRIVTGNIENGRIIPQVLVDFNANKPERVQSPDWAKTWDDRT